MIFQGHIESDKTGTETQVSRFLPHVLFFLCSARSNSLHLFASHVILWTNRHVLWVLHWEFLDNKGHETLDFQNFYNRISHSKKLMYMESKRGRKADRRMEGRQEEKKIRRKNWKIGKNKEEKKRTLKRASLWFERPFRNSRYTGKNMNLQLRETSSEFMSHLNGLWPWLKLLPLLCVFPHL